jgi:hypothetical protein
MFSQYFNTQGSFFNDSAYNLFMDPMNGKISDLIYIADNTFMFSCFLAFMNSSSSSSSCASI